MVLTAKTNCGPLCGPLGDSHIDLMVIAHIHGEPPTCQALL